MTTITAANTTKQNPEAIRFALPLALVLILLLATGLRFYKLDAQSFWNDEGNSARLSERSLQSIIEGTASDVHPPLYYILLRGWRELAGDSEFALRSFSAFAGVLTVAAASSLARLVYVPPRRNRSSVLVVILTALFAAINPALVYYSQETRMYALLALLATLSTLVLLRWLNAHQRWPWVVAYVVTSTAGLYTHYFYPALFVMQGFIVFAWLFRKQILLTLTPFKLVAEPGWLRTPLMWLSMTFVSFLLYVPWLPIFLRQTGGRAAERASIPKFIWDSVRWMIFGETIANDEMLWLTAAAVILLLWAFVVSGRRIIIPSIGVLILLSAMYVAGTTNPAFFKFMLVAVPLLLVWLAGSIWTSREDRTAARIVMRIAAIIVIILVAFGMLLSLNNLYNDPAFARADYRGMAARIALEDYPNAAVILNAPNQWEVFTYYHVEGAPVYPLPTGQPDPAILEPQLAEIAGQHERLYVLYWGDDQRDPQSVVERWLDRYAFKASEEWVGDVRFVVYGSTIQVPGGPDIQLDAGFGNKIKLHGYTIDGETFKPEDIVQTTLYWSADRPLDQRYKVFVHLVNLDGLLVAQQDAEPGSDSSPTTIWQPNEMIIDNHGILLPEELAAGEYELLVGLYEANNPAARLQVDGSENNLDIISLGKIDIE